MQAAIERAFLEGDDAAFDALRGDGARGVLRSPPAAASRRRRVLGELRRGVRARRRRPRADRRDGAPRGGGEGAAGGGGAAFGRRRGPDASEPRREHRRRLGAAVRVRGYRLHARPGARGARALRGARRGGDENERVSAQRGPGRGGPGVGQGVDPRILRTRAPSCGGAKIWVRARVQAAAAGRSGNRRWARSSSSYPGGTRFLSSATSSRATRGSRATSWCSRFTRWFPRASRSACSSARRGASRRWCWRPTSPRRR